MQALAFWRWEGDTLSLRCQVQPRACSDLIVGEHAGRLRIRVSAPPSDGAANERLCQLLAREFGVPARAVEIANGHGNRLKTALVRAPTRIPLGLGIGPRSSASARGC